MVLENAICENRGQIFILDNTYHFLEERSSASQGSKSKVKDKDLTPRPQFMPIRIRHHDKGNRGCKWLILEEL